MPRGRSPAQPGPWWLAPLSWPCCCQGYLRECLKLVDLAVDIHHLSNFSWMYHTLSLTTWDKSPWIVSSMLVNSFNQASAGPSYWHSRPPPWDLGFSLAGKQAHGIAVPAHCSPVCPWGGLPQSNAPDMLLWLCDIWPCPQLHMVPSSLATSLVVGPLAAFHGLLQQLGFPW